MYDRGVLRPTAAGWMLVALLGAACTSTFPAETAGPEAAKATGPPSVIIPTASPDAGSVGPPARPRFAGRISPLPPSFRKEMRGTTWKPGCPVPLDELALLRFNYWTFDGEIGRGPMVVHEDVAQDVLGVFRRLFRSGFPIKRVAVAREFVPEEFEPVINSRRSVTAAFNCRPVITPRGPLNDFSRHSYGTAIDINPVQNPYVDSDGFVRNRASRRYLDRSRQLEGMIHDGDVVVRSFARIGWEWGGHWGGGKDYMHFAVPG
jgi:hypothetical protein